MSAARHRRSRRDVESRREPFAWQPNDFPRKSAKAVGGSMRQRVPSKKSIEPSRSSMIVTEESPKSLAATDGAVSTRWCEAFWRNQPIVKTLVISFRVIMRLECGERSA
jgi:hypothetical protein